MERGVGGWGGGVDTYKNKGWEAWHREVVCKGPWGITYWLAGLVRSVCLIGV